MRRDEVIALVAVVVLTTGISAIAVATTLSTAPLSKLIEWSCLRPASRVTG